MIEKLLLKQGRTYESTMGNIEVMPPEFDNHEIGEKINEIIDFCNRIDKNEKG